MNDKQKLLVMVGAGSLLVILITIFGLGFGYERWFSTSNIDTSVERWEKETGLKFEERVLEDPPVSGANGFSLELLLYMYEQNPYRTIVKTEEYESWVSDTNSKEGTWVSRLYLEDFFKKRFRGKEGFKTNWLGIIASFNIAFCITGFFLFKDK